MRFPLPTPAYSLTAIVVLAGVLDFYHLDRTSLWNDEAFSFFAARSGLGHTLRFIADDTQPPVYYLTLSLWLGLGGSVFVIRALSAAAMTLAVVPVYGAARLLFGETVAVLAGLLFAIAPLDVSWAAKARPYPLQVLFVACAFWGFVRVLRGGEQVIGAGLIRTRSVDGASVALGWLAYALFGALAMLVQAPAGFFVLGCNVAMLFLICADIRRRWTLLLNWVVAQGVLIAIWALWLPSFLRQIAAHLTPEQIASRHSIFLVGFGQVLGSLEGLFGIAGLWRLGVVFVPVYLAIAAFGVVQIVRRRRAAWPLAVVIAVPIIACLAGFFLVHPIFGYAIGTFVWMLVPYSILIAFGVASIRPVVLRRGVLLVVVAGNVWGLKNVYQTDTPPLDRVGEIIRAQMAPGDGIVLSAAGSGRWGIAYYVGPPFGALAGLGIEDWGDGGLLRSVADLEGLKRVWVVVGDGETPAVDLAGPAGFAERVGAFQVSRFDLVGGR
jgi:uncharacterized membrane protein